MSFRIKVKLSKIFDDHRQVAYINIDKGWKYVLNLEHHIARLFNMKDSFIIKTEDDVLLPSMEKIDVICVNDVLEVHPTTDIKSFQNKPERRRNPKTTEINCDNGSPPNVRNFEEHTINVDLSQCDVVDQKRKRKRKRQKKHNTSPINEVQNDQVMPQPIMETPIVGNQSRKHLHFDDSGKSIDTKSKKLNEKVRIIVEESNKVAVKSISSSAPRVVRAIIPQSLDFENGVSVESTIPDKTDSVLNGAHNGNIDSNSKSSYIENRTTEVTDNKKNNSAMEDIRKNIDVLNLDILTELPKENDVIAFKYLKIDDHSCPVLTDYIVGMVESIDEENQNLKIYILAGNEEKNYTYSINEMNITIGNDEKKDADDLLLNWKDLVLPKLIKV